MLVNETRSFRELCQENGIAVTHQRQVLYEVMKTMHGHPSPEEVYARVKKKVPAISLATVYKNIHLFVESGVFREVSMHHGSLRVEMNDEAHHHMVCSKCKAITDIGEKRAWADVEARQAAWRISGGAVCSGCHWHLCKVPTILERFLNECKR
jgi:Fur family transcriptional regulator, peroxide stress response regulator